MKRANHSCNHSVMGETTPNFGSYSDLGSVDSDSRIVTSTHALVLNQRKEKALLELMEKTGYSIIQENGQRKYGGPPPGWTGVSPPKGSEIFVGKIPRDLFEDELVPVFETVGPIYEMRLMMDFSGCNRGYAFVMYTTPQIATNAVRKFNNFEIRKGKFLGVVKSVDNCRLFVGGIPKTKGREEILEEMQKVTEGVKDVILYSSVTDKSKSRGFAFIEYENHRAAAMARRKLVPGRRILLWGHEIAVDWAEPEPEVDEDTMSKVTVLYVRNLMLGTTEDQIRDAFNSVSLNGVEKVKKIRDFAFVHFTSRQRAEMALFAFDNKKLDEAEIEVTWAKPVDRNYYRMNKAISKGMFGNTGYGTLAFGQHGTYDPSLATNFLNLAQSAPNSSDLLRFPLKHLSRGAAGIRGSRSTLSLSPGYVKFAKSYSEIRPLYEIQPGMELIPTNHFTLKPLKSPIQQLHELCHKNGWGEPTFCLLTLDSQDDSSNGTSKLYAYKVSISGLQAPYNSFQPDKLCDSPEDARNHAAVNVLKQLGVVTSEGLDTLSRQLSGVSISNPINQSTVTPGTMLSVGPYAQQYLMASKLPSKEVTSFSNGMCGVGLPPQHQSVSPPGSHSSNCYTYENSHPNSNSTVLGWPSHLQYPIPSVNNGNLVLGVNDDVQQCSVHTSHCCTPMMC